MSMMLLNVAGASAFLVSQDTTHPFLSRFADAQAGQLLHIDLDIAPQGDPSTPSLLPSFKRTHTTTPSQYTSRMYISNMVVELQNSPPLTNQELKNDGIGSSSTPTYVPPMIANRINNNKLSKNSLMLNIDTPGSFVSMSGTQSIPFNKDDCTWEIKWMAGQPAGFILCGLSLEKEVRRNDAILSPGEMYMNIPLWTRDGLDMVRKERVRVEKVYNTHLTEKKAQLRKSSEATNPFQKVIHFQKATAADEKLTGINIQKYQHVPMDDEELMSVGHDLLLGCKGTIWKKNSGRRRRSNGFSFLGNANVKKVESRSMVEEVNNSKVLVEQ